MLASVSMFQRVAFDTVFLRHDVVPNMQAGRSSGVTRTRDVAQSCFVSSVDNPGPSDVPGVLVAGDGIGGSKAAEINGRLPHPGPWAQIHGPSR